MRCSSPVLAGLFTYPVKALRGLAHPSIEVCAAGLRGDRSWMLVDARQSPARFVTQRERPELACFAAQVSAQGALELTAPSGARFVLEPGEPTSRVRVRLWRREIEAIDEGDAVAAWWAHELCQPGLRLVRVDERAIAESAAARGFFSDAAPVLVTNLASLAALNAALYGGRGGNLPMDRFRPNLVLDGLGAWEEDSIDRLVFGEVVLRFTKPCVRCEVTTTDQSTGVRLGSEPLVTLARLRNDPDEGGATFGRYAVVERPGRVTLGQ
ncbi:MAG: MOSC domain-containing protein, partial [Casimicrobiaceae bacterium]|nr:MOSC domain-containing protein [Casimicrobiaceae bacterium]